MNEKNFLKSRIALKPKSSREHIISAIEQLTEHQCSIIVNAIKKEEGGLSLQIADLNIYNEVGNEFSVQFSTGFTFGGRF